MKIKIIFFILLFTSKILSSQSNKSTTDTSQTSKTEPIDSTEEVPKNWEFTFALGIDLSHTLNINTKNNAPKSGFSTSDAIDMGLNYQKEGSAFQMTNELHWQFAFFKGGNSGDNIQRTTDNLSTLHDWSTSFSGKNNKWSVNLITKFNSSIFTVYDGDYLSDYNALGKIQKFASPYELILSPGIKYMPSKYLRISISPLSIRYYGVPDQEISDKGIYIEEIDSATLAYKQLIKEYSNAALNIWYDRSIKKRIKMQYRLGVTSNYNTNILGNGVATGLFITSVRILGNIYFTHRATLSAILEEQPFKPTYTQAMTISYAVKL
jgi:hypothetical protein